LSSFELKNFMLPP